MNEIEQWGTFEAAFTGSAQGNPFTDTSLRAIFSLGEQQVQVNGFYDGNGVYKLRFMPTLPGHWAFTTSSADSSLDGITGDFDCIPPQTGNHGPVLVKNQFNFAYADETPYFPFGTTCYAWIHQTEALEELTLKTLASAPFNKLRMCVFPKHYEFNENEPALYPYEGNLDAGFDFKRFNPAFFRHLEQRIVDLQKLGIECDLILFHPYDRWGFSHMGRENDDMYLRYIVARLAPYRNVWWSLANEYDLMETSLLNPRPPAKEHADWDRFADIVRQTDPYGHLLSIHNWIMLYDFGKPWVTHCSIQRVDVFKTAENADAWRRQYKKPVVIDECAYEGNIDQGWGNLTGEEMTRRFWEGFLRGGYVGHGETYMHPLNILWWSHGGELHGTSPERIAFLRKIIEEAPAPVAPIESEGPSMNWDVTIGACGSDYFIYYFGFSQPSFRSFTLPEGRRYRADIIDTWAMTITPVPSDLKGGFRLELPGRQYIAVRFAAV